MKEQFKEINFTPAVLAIIAQADEIIAGYAAQGYDMTVRQVHYQFVTRNVYKNTQANYNRLAEIVSNARIAGLIDWGYIKDRGRVTHLNQGWKSPKEFLGGAAEQYVLNKWLDQPNYIELMVEKQALEGVLAPVCDDWQVAFTSNKGYGSSSMLYERGKYLQSMRDVEGKEVHVIYLGDHDPSGLDMSRDIKDRLEMFSDGPVNVHRIALNFEQVGALNIPENPAKMTDSRAEKYVEQYGESSWELDAIEPLQLVQLVTGRIRSLLNTDLWAKAIMTEDKHQDILQDIVQSL